MTAVLEQTSEPEHVQDHEVVILPNGVDLVTLATARPCPETVRVSPSLWRLRRRFLNQNTNT